MIKLQLIETLNDGSVNEFDLSDGPHLPSQSGALYSVINMDEGTQPEPMSVYRSGIDLLVMVDGEVTLTLDGFFSNGANATFLTPSQGEAQASLEIRSSLNSAESELIWQAQSYEAPELKVASFQVDSSSVALIAALAAVSPSSGESSGESSGASSAATTPPVYTSLSVDTSSNVIVITYDSTLDGTNLPDATDFTISQNSGPVSVASVAVSGSTVILTLASVINSGESLTVAYTDPTSGNDAAAIQGIAGDDAASISKTLAAGMVADGYIRGATVFIDTDGDGYYTAGVDVVLGTTDANGAFMIPDGVTGTVIASGGVNIDTGLPNTLTLMAPEGSSVINPLTTLVEEYLVANAGAVTASEASAAVSTALGLPTGVDLLFFDPLNTTNSITTDGIDVQKAAAQVATMLTLVADTQATTLNAQTAVANVTQKLIASIKSVADGTTIAVDLADASQITALVAGVTSGNIASLVSDANTANSSISTASNISNISQAQSSALDDISPILKGLGLTAATDSGTSATDSMTNVSGATLRVSLEVTATDGSATVIGDTIKTTQDGVSLANHVIVAGDIIAGYVDIKVTLASASHTFNAFITDAAGNNSAAQTSTLTYDSLAPPVALTSSLLTNNSAPTISGTAEADATVSVVVGGATYTVIAQSGVWSINLASAIADSGVLSLDLNGTNVIAVTASDIAGNTSSPISSNLVIDSISPTLNGLGLTAATDSGTSATDSITNVSGAALRVSLEVTATDGSATVIGDTIKTTQDGVSLANHVIVAGDIIAGYVDINVTLASANHTFNALVTDAAGNNSAALTSLVTLDSLAPAVALTSSLLTNNSAPTISGTAETDATVTAVVGGATYAVIAQSGVWSIDLASAIADSGVLNLDLNGTNVIAVTASDIAGNTSSTISSNLVIDAIAPIAPVAPALLASSNTGSTADLITYDTTPTVQVTLNAAAGAGAGHVAGDTVKVLVGGIVNQTQVVTSSDITAGYVNVTLPSQADGTLAITAQLVDAIGNTSVASATTLTMTLDSTAPSLTITDTTSDAITDGSDVTFTFTFDEVVEGFTASEITISGGVKGAFAGSGAVYTLVVTPDDGQSSGSIDVSVNGSSATSVTNLAGINMAATIYTHSQAYDTLGPVVSSVEVPPGKTYGEGDNLIFVVTFDETLDTNAAAPLLNITVGTDSHTITGGTVSGTQITYTHTVLNIDGANGTSLALVSLSNSATDALGNVTTNPTLNGVSSSAAVIVDGSTAGSGVDGYLSGVTIYSDNDGDGELSSGDGVAVANATGGFKMYGGDGPIIMYGGTDISTGLEFGVQYEAPMGYTIINPISTLVRAVQRDAEAGDNSLTSDQAYEVIRGAIYGTNTGVTASQAPTYDPFRIAVNADTDAASSAAVNYQRAAAAVATVVEVVSEAMVAIGVSDGADSPVALTQKQASVVVVDAMIDAINTTPINNGTLLNDLADASSNGFLATLLASVSTNAFLPLTEDQKLAAVDIIATAVSSITNAGGADAISSLTEITKVQLVAQGEAGADLASYLKGDILAPEFSSASFSTAVADASVGVVVPVTYSINKADTNDAVLEGQNGEAPSLDFVVTRQGNTSVTSTIEWVVSGGAMLDASHFAFNAIPSGVLTFQAGESEKTITIAIAGNDIEDGNRPFKVSLIDPFGTASMINEHAFAVIQDDDPFTPVITLDASSQITANKSSLINASVDYYDADAILAVAVSVENAIVSSAAFSGNLATINSQLKSLTIAGTSGSKEGSVTIDVTVDGRQGSGQSELSIHNAPHALVPDTNETHIQVIAGKATLVSDLSVQDVDSSNLSVSLISASGSLELVDASDISVKTVGNGIELYGSAMDINSALTGLYFTADAKAMSASIQLTVDDGDLLTDSSNATVSLSVQAADPIMILADGASTLTKGKASALAGISIADSDSELLSLTLVATEGTLSVVNSGLTEVIGSGGDTLTLTGSPAGINTTLDSLRFTTTQDASLPTLSASLSDHDELSTADPVSVAIPLAVVSNTPPVSGGDQTTTAINEDSGATTITVTGIELSDEDGTEPSHIRILAADGATINNGILVGNSGSLIEVTGGSVSISMTPDTNRTDGITLTYAVVDPLINTLNSPPATIGIPITAINDALVISSVAESLTYTEGGADVGVASRFTISDIDGNSVHSASVTIDNVQTGDLLKVTATDPIITPTYANGVLTLSGVSDLITYQEMLAKVMLSNTSDNPSTVDRSVTIEVTDVDQFGAVGESTSVTRTVSVQNVNDAPILNVSQLSASFTEGDAALHLFEASGVEVSDADDTLLSGATVSMTSGYRPGEDILTVTGLPAGITAVFSNISGALILAGEATLANYITALSAITFTDLSDAPSTIGRTISLVVTDPHGQNSNSINLALSVNGVADAPEMSLNGMESGASHRVVFVNSLYPDGVAIAAKAKLSDIDSATIGSVTVTLTGESTDTLTLSDSAQALVKANAMTLDNTGTVLHFSSAASATVYESLLQGVLYTSTAEQGSDRSVSVRVVDASDSSVSVTDTVTLVQAQNPFAAIAAGTKILKLSGEDVTGDVRIDLPAMSVTANSSAIAVAGDAIFTAKHIDGSVPDGADPLDVNLTIIGTSQDNIITAGAGDDVIYGGGGADTINAGAGNDSIMYQASTTIDGGEGIDTLLVTSNFQLSEHVADITNVEVISALNATSAVSLLGTAAAETLIGGDYADTLTLSAGDIATGGQGNDTFDVTQSGTIAAVSAITITDIGLGDTLLIVESESESESAVAPQPNTDGVLSFNGGSQQVTLTGWDSSWSLKQLATGQYTVVKVPNQTVVIESMSKDSGQNDDWITANGNENRLISGSISAGLNTSEVVEISFDNGSSWASATTSGTRWSVIDPQQHDATWTMQVRVRNTAEDVFDATKVASQTVVLDTTANALAINLTTDSGVSDDAITHTGTYEITGQEKGASVNYSTDNGVIWSDQAPTAKSGINSIQVRQIDVAGNKSDTSELSFTLDTMAPTNPLVSLQTDSAVVGDRISNAAVLNVEVRTGAESGRVEYSSDNQTWSANPPAATAGDNTVHARLVDTAGNASNTTTYSYYFDATHPNKLALGLVSDTGPSASDGSTNNPNMTISNLEKGASWQYSADGGNTWATGSGSGFELADGVYSSESIQARQIDVAGNVSESTLIMTDLVIDTVEPDAPGVSTVAGDNIVNITEFGTGVTLEGTTEEGSSVSISWGAISNSAAIVTGTSWSLVIATADIPMVGDVSVTTTDVAGNVSATTTKAVTVELGTVELGTSAEDVFNLIDLPANIVIDGGEGTEFDTLVLDSSLYDNSDSIVIDTSSNTLTVGTTHITSLGDLGDSRFSLMDADGNLFVLRNIEAIEVSDQVFNIQPEVWQPVESVTRYDGTVWEDDVVIDLTQLLGEATQGSLTQDGTQIKLDNELLLSISQDTSSGEALQLIAKADGTRILEFSGVEHVTFTTGDTDDPNLLITEFLGLI